MGRAPCCDKANVKKGPWSPEEDAKLKSYIEKNGTGGNWIALPQKIGLKRCGKSCRLRWLNYLRPNIKHGGFSEEEDRVICSLYGSIGSRWSIIAAQLPGRTDNDIKNYWNTRLKKKLLGKQRKEQHHYSSSSSGRKSKRLLLSSDLHHIDNTINHAGLLSSNNNPTNFNTHGQVMFPYNCWPPIQSATGHETLPGGLFSEDESMRSLLVKLEHQHQPMYYEQDGLVSLHHPFINGQDHPHHSQMESDHLVSMLNLEGQMISSLQNDPTTSTHHPSGFPRELEELMSSSINQRMDGPDRFQQAWEDQAVMINNTGAGSETSCGESMGPTSWCEMSALISLPMSSNNASCQGFAPQDEDYQLRYTTSGN